MLTLPKEWAFIFPEIALWEIADATLKDGSDPSKVQARLHSLYSSHSSQLFLGEYPKTLVRREKGGGPRARTPVLQIVHREQSHRFREMRDWSQADFLRGINRIRGQETSIHRDKKRFDQFRLAFSASARENFAEVVKRSSGNEEELLNFIRMPDAIIRYAKFRLPGVWRKSCWPGLARFPDQLAMGRWMRLELWYLLKVLRGAASDAWRNDFEDIHYAFLASYCGNLVTSDSGLRKACNHVYPWVRVVRCPSDLK